MPPRGAYPDEHTPPPDPVDELPLFAEPPAFPTRPAAPRGEQRVLPIRGTIAERYRAWRATEDGQGVWAWIVQRALEEVASGATRLSAKELTEAARHHLHIQVNNVFTPELARELEERHPMLRGLFELRKRQSA